MQSAEEPAKQLNPPKRSSEPALAELSTGASSGANGSATPAEPVTPAGCAGETGGDASRDQSRAMAFGETAGDSGGRCMRSRPRRWGCMRLHGEILVEGRHSEIVLLGCIDTPMSTDCQT